MCQKSAWSSPAFPQVIKDGSFQRFILPLNNALSSIGNKIAWCTSYKRNIPVNLASKVGLRLKIDNHSIELNSAYTNNLTIIQVKKIFSEK